MNPRSTWGQKWSSLEQVPRFKKILIINAAKLNNLPLFTILVIGMSVRGHPFIRAKSAAFWAVFALMNALIFAGGSGRIAKIGDAPWQSVKIQLEISGKLSKSALKKVLSDSRHRCRSAETCLTQPVRPNLVRQGSPPKPVPTRLKKKLPSYRSNLLHRDMQAIIKASTKKKGDSTDETF